MENEMAQLLDIDGNLLYEGEGGVREAAEDAVREEVDLNGAWLKDAWLNGALLNGARLNGANMEFAELNGAWLKSAQLNGAHMAGAQWEGAQLKGAQLENITGYSESHEIFQELVRQLPSRQVTIEEWGMVGIIVTHRLCWESIWNRLGEKIVPLFQKLAERGFPEYLERYNELSF